MVVQINPEDIPEEYAGKGAFAGLEFQKDVERKMWEYARDHSGSGNPFTAPAQRMVDFCEGEESADLPQTSYKPGVVPAPLHELLPGVIAERLQDVFPLVNQKTMRGHRRHQLRRGRSPFPLRSRCPGRVGRGVGRFRRRI